MKPWKDSRTPFEIAVGANDVRVSLDGREILRCGLGGHRLSGPWGVAAFEGYAVIWDDVALR